MGMMMMVVDMCPCSTVPDPGYRISILRELVIHCEDPCQSLPLFNGIPRDDYLVLPPLQPPGPKESIENSIRSGVSSGGCENKKKIYI